MGKTTQTEEKPVKTRSKFGALLSGLGRKKKQGPSQDELDQQAAKKLELDRTAVKELEHSLQVAKVTVPPVISAALATELRGLKPQQVGIEQTKASEALAAKAAVAAYIKGRKDLQIGKDQASLLKFGSHALIVKFTNAIDHIGNTAEQRWAQASKASEAVTHADFLTQQLAGSVRLRGEVHGRLEEADKTIVKAELALSKVSGLGTVDVGTARTKVEGARKAFGEIKASEDIGKALALLDGYDTDLLQATKGQSKPLANLATYRKTRQSVLDQIGKASLLRGATEDTPLRQLLESARIDIGLADEAMSKASGPELIEKALEILGQHKGLLDRAKKIDAELKKQAQADLEALPKYTAAFNALQRAREQMAGMPGTTDQLREADIALGASRLGGDGKPPGGYAAALKLLEGKAQALLKQATEVSGNFVQQRSGQFPGLAKARLEAENVLSNFMNVHPPAQAGAQQQALAQALAEDDPTAALQRLVTQWNLAVQAQREVDQKLFAERRRMEDLLGKLEKLHTPKQVLDSLRNTENVDRLRQGNEYAQALVIAERATKAADAYLLVATQLENDWKTAETELKELSDKASRWADWPPLAPEANSIAGDARRIVEAVGKGESLEGALAAVGRLKVRLEALELQSATQQIGPQVDLKAYAQAVESARKEWTSALTPARQSVAALAEALKQAGAGASATSTTWHEQLAALEKRWEAVLAKPNLAQGQAPGDWLREQLVQFKNEVAVIQREALAAASDRNQLAPLLKTAQDKDTEQRLRQLHAELIEQVELLETTNAKTDAFWTVLGRDFDPVKAPGLEDKWKKLGPILERTIEVKRQELLKVREEGVKTADELDKKLNRLLSVNQARFPGYFEDLRGKSADARAMMMTGDPSLMVAGQRQIEELARMFAEADQGGESEGGEPLKTFDNVAQLYQQLSKQVGLEVLMKRLPATYSKLYGQLIAAVEEAKSLPPSKGYLVLDALRLPIEEAVAQAEVVAERYTVFKARQEQVEQRLVELHKMTGTRFTEKTDAYNEKFANRVASARQMAKQEGQMDQAFDMLGQLDKELTTLMSRPETARTELQKLDGEAAAEQRELRDLCRNWEAARKYWDDTLLPQVKKAIAKRDEPGDEQEYESLKGAVSQAGAPVKGYLDVISSLPHEYLAANNSPDMKQARSAFSSAQARLRQLERTANRMISGGGNTNVDLQEDLGKLEAEWINRVQRLHSALGKLSDSVRGLPDQASSDQNDSENYLDPKNLGQLRTACNVVGRSLPEAAARFVESAFSAPLAVLRGDSATPAERKKAREDALRTMRVLRDELVDSALFRHLFEGAASGALDVDVRPQIGLVRASLKKIELAVLVAA
jgi:hypothetical protein